MITYFVLFSDMLPSHPKDIEFKYPQIDHSYESVDYPGLYYAGTATHSLDWRKSAGGFIHGFRYTGRHTLFFLVTNRNIYYFRPFWLCVQSRLSVVRLFVY